MKVTAPGGTTYRVRRRWLPWRLRRRFSPRPLDLGLDATDADFDSVGGFVASIVAGLLLIFLLPVVVLVLVAGIEFLLLLALLPLAVAGRVLLGRHWRVEVRQGRTLLYDVDGGDWARSRVVIGDLAEQIRLGQVDATPELDGYARASRLVDPH